MYTGNRIKLEIKPAANIAHHSNTLIFIGQTHRSAPTFSHDALSTGFAEVAVNYYFVQISVHFALFTFFFFLQLLYVFVYEILQSAFVTGASGFKFPFTAFFVQTSKFYRRFNGKIFVQFVFGDFFIGLSVVNTNK